MDDNNTNLNLDNNNNIPNTENDVNKDANIYPDANKNLTSDANVELNNDFQPQHQPTEQPYHEFSFLSFIPEKYRDKKYFLIAIIAIFLIGLIFGGIFFGGSSSNTKSTGLAGVVANMEVPAGRPRCGMVEYGQGCVLYIVNAQRREINAKELYTLAAQMTKVPVYLIETGNLRYNNTLIKPGYIAQINIQPTR